MDNCQSKTDEELVNYCAEGMVYANAAQVEMMRRLKNAIENLDKNTKIYSGKLIDLTILLFFVALIQVLVSIMATPQSWITKISMSIIVMYAIYFIVRRITEKNN